ncbi:MAG: hypothetical protein AAFR88_09775, partial [Pseudomonadota bacterium]
MIKRRASHLVSLLALGLIACSAPPNETIASASPGASAGTTITGAVSAADPRAQAAGDAILAKGATPGEGVVGVWIK